MRWWKRRWICPRRDARAPLDRSDAGGGRRGAIVGEVDRGDAGGAGRLGARLQPACSRSPTGSSAACRSTRRRTSARSRPPSSLYDTPKVLLLLTLVVFGMGVVRSFFSPERTRALARRPARGRRQRRRRQPRHRHAVLLVLGGAAVHRLRLGRRAARRDLLLPDRRADGQRGGARPAVRAWSAGRWR